MRIFNVVMGDNYHSQMYIIFAENEAEIMRKYVGVISITEVIIH